MGSSFFCHIMRTILILRQVSHMQFIKKIMPYVANRYFVVSIGFVVWMLFFDQRDFFLQRERKAELEKLATAFQADVQKYQQEGAKLTAQQREAKEAELGKTQQNLQQMSQTAQKDLLDRQDAAYAPIEKRLNDAITRAAKANGWDFIFDSATNGLIYKAGPDATAAVKKELGI